MLELGLASSPLGVYVILGAAYFLAHHEFYTRWLRNYTYVCIYYIKMWPQVSLEKQGKKEKSNRNGAHGSAGVSRISLKVRG